MKMKDRTNAELLFELEHACFLLAHYNGNKTHAKRLEMLEKEMCKRLGVSEEAWNALQN